MFRNRKRSWLYAALACVGLLLAGLALEARTARADPSTTRSGWPSEVALPAGRKLVSVTWLCYQACEPWALTRPMRPGETTESYAFTNGRETIVYRESVPTR